MDRNVNIITDLKGNKIVLINDIIFKGKRSVNWDDVKNYLEIYVGEFYEIADTNDIVYIGKELPDEYTGSRYTYSLKGANAKAKANASQGIPEMLEIGVKHDFLIINWKNRKKGGVRQRRYCGNVYNWLVYGTVEKPVCRMWESCTLLFHRL